jgi:uncharacterized membrane protein
VDANTTGSGSPGGPAPASPSGLMPSGRLEAFSDGVFAIAITLLVIDLAVPDLHEAAEQGGLGTALFHQWPSYLAYLVSFLVIGIIWVNHHSVFDKVRQVDRPVLFANLALLFTVVTIPFSTRLIAEYLTAGSDAHLAAAVYSATMLLMGLTYSLLWLAVTRDARLLHSHVDVAAGRAALRRFGFGNIFYLATIGLSFVSAVATLIVHGALALYYCFDQLRVGPRSS